MYLSHPHIRTATGRIFYGIAIAVIGFQMVYLHKFPYILPLPDHFPATAGAVSAVVSGTLLFAAGLCLIFKLKAGKAALLLGSMLLLLFCLYYIPYQFLVSPGYTHPEDWENAEKELAFAGGALVIAGCFPGRKDDRLSTLSGRLVPFGPVLFAVTMIAFGILHFKVAHEAAMLVPSWIPYAIFWIYFCGAALIGSGLAILFKIKTGLAAALLGLMIFLWFILLHVPRVIAAPAASAGDEIASAFFALAYSGIALVISGEANKRSGNLADD